MNTDDLTAAVARLLADANEDPAHTPWSRDVRTVLSALERLAQERDALRECVRAADAMADAYYPDPFHHAPPLTVDAYNAARAKVNTTEGEK